MAEFERFDSRVSFSIDLGRDRWLVCTVGDAAGDFTILVRSATNHARVGFSMVTAKRLIATLKSKGGSRFQEEQTAFARKLNIPARGFLIVTARPNGSYDFAAAETGGLGIALDDNNEAIAVGEQGFYYPTKINVAAKHIADLITSMEELIKIVPPQVEKYLTDDFLTELPEVGVQYTALVAQGRYDDALELFHDEHRRHSQKKMAEYKARYDALSPEDKARSDARAREVAQMIANALRGI
jgi:hypothetical protein